MKCPVCEKAIDVTVQKCPCCGFGDLRTEFINENELKMWQTYVVYPCRFAYQTSIAQTKELQKKLQKELNTIKKEYKELQELIKGFDGNKVNNEHPSFKGIKVQKKDGWSTEQNITYKLFSECYWGPGRFTKCEISDLSLDFVGNRVIVHFFAKKVFDHMGADATSYIAFKWKLKDDFGIVVADGFWQNDRLNVGDVTKDAFSISGIDSSIKYVLELVNY